MKNSILNGTLHPSFFPYHVDEVIRNEDNFLVKLEMDTRDNTYRGIACLDTNGKLLWKKILNNQRFLALTQTPYGIVYIINTEADVLDAKTGISKMNKKLDLFYRTKKLVKIVQNGDCFAVLHGDTLYELNYKTAEYKLLKNKFGFEGDETDKIPNFFEVREKGYLLASDQNLLFLDFEGKEVYRRYYKKLGMSANTKRLIGRAVGFTAGMIFKKEARMLTDIMYQSGNMSFDKRLDVSLKDYYRNGLGSAGVASEQAANLFARTKQRAGMVKTNANHRLILTKLETGGVGFVKVDKNSGKELKTIRLDDRDPEIIIDDIAEGMYFFPNKKQVNFYSLSDQ